MGEGKSHGGDDQGNADQKERQGDHTSTARTPQVDVILVEPPSEFDAFGDSNGKQEPKISEQHQAERASPEKGRRRVFPNLNLPEWITAISGAVATLVAFSALDISRNGVRVTEAQLEEMRSSSAQTDQIVATAIKQAEATKAIAEVARNSLAVEQRAWLGPSQAAFTDGVAIGEKIRPTIYHRNFGKSPALFVNVDMDIRIRPNENGHLSEATKKIIIDDANACLRKNYGTVGAVVFPESLYSYKYDAIGRDTGTPFYDIAFTDRMVSGKDVVIIDGCINYKTMGINAHTAFCFYYEAGESKVEALSICRIGNQAD